MGIFFLLQKIDFFNFFFFSVCWMEKNLQNNFSAGKQLDFLLCCSSKEEFTPCSRRVGRILPPWVPSCGTCHEFHVVTPALNPVTGLAGMHLPETSHLFEREMGRVPRLPWEFPLMPYLIMLLKTLCLLQGRADLLPPSLPSSLRHSKGWGNARAQKEEKNKNQRGFEPLCGTQPAQAGDGGLRPDPRLGFSRCSGVRCGGAGRMLPSGGMGSQRQPAPSRPCLAAWPGLLCQQLHKKPL